MIIRLKLSKSKLKQELFYKGAKDTYIDVTLLENKNGTDEYGNDFMCVQDISKEARDRGEKGPIVGNAKFVGERPAGARQPAPQPAPRTAGPVEEHMEGDPAW